MAPRCHAGTAVVLVVAAVVDGAEGTFPALDECRRTAACQECLDAIRLGQTTPITSTPNPSLAETEFFHSVVTSAECGVTAAPLLTRVIDGLKDNFAEYNVGFFINPCMAAELHCALLPECRRCLAAIIERSADRSRDSDVLFQTVRGPACRAAVASNASVLSELVTTACTTFPKCNFAKMQCNRSAVCTEGMRTLASNGADGVNRVLALYNETASHALIDTTVQACAAFSSVACSYWSARCSNSPACSACLNAQGNGDSETAIVSGMQSNACEGLVDGESHYYLLMMYSQCPSTSISTCLGVVGSCVVTTPLCTQCLNGTVPPTSPRCQFILNQSGFGVASACEGCPAVLNLINGLTLATSVVGAFSGAACLTVIYLIFARGRDRTAMRDRIVMGIMTANAIYSSANAIPITKVHTDNARCGQLSLPFRTICFARAWWFLGKYTLVCFELFILVASTWSLVRGRPVPSLAEAGAHTMCILGGLSAFAYFLIRCTEIRNEGYNSATQSLSASDSYAYLNMDDTSDDDNPQVAAAQKFENATDNYNNLMQTMLQAWLALLGVAIVNWAVLRTTFAWKVKMWRRHARAVTRMEEEDEWADTRRARWSAIHKSVDMQRAAFFSIAKPLEPYVLVFVVFGIPAVVMALDWCQSNSQANVSGKSLETTNDAISYGMCDVWCEFVLAFRSITVVAVYFLSRERRVDLWEVRITWRLFRTRLGRLCWRGRARSRTVRFGEVSYLRPRTPGRPIDNSEIKLEEVLAEGTFGTVWRARWGPWRKVAVKVLRASGVDEDGDPIDSAADEDFRTECKMLGEVYHPHVLKLFGYGLNSQGRWFIVTELMALGSLRDVLKDTGRPLPWFTRRSIALQLAMGMQHMHSIPILHRDLKSPNVLLDDRMIVKVADFGSCKVFRPQQQHTVHSSFTGETWMTPTLAEDSPHVFGEVDDVAQPGAVVPAPLDRQAFDAGAEMTRAVGTMLWMAPEVFRGDAVYGPEVDVFSFGIIMWEIATRERPWDELGVDLNRAELFSALAKALQTGRRPMLSRQKAVEHPDYVALMEKCWAGDWTERPTFAEAAEALSYYFDSDDPQDDDDAAAAAAPVHVDGLRVPLLAG